jgi:hypothetical protein
VNAKNDLCRITRDHHENGKDHHGDEEQRYEEDDDSLKQISSHISKEKA